MEIFMTRLNVQLHAIGGAVTTIPYRPRQIAAVDVSAHKNRVQKHPRSALSICRTEAKRVDG
jgi:protein tyrosine phosphatase (PTP) superfamily phosphohydrolase (DUF442 family)